MTTDVREITADELAGIVSDGLEDADLTRARGLSNLLDFRLARLDGLRRELDLRRSVDDADPRLELLQERLAATELTARALDLEALRAVTPPAAASADEGTVEGRVVLPAGEMPDDARVRLRDQGGNLVRGIEGRLDAGGAFSIKVPVSGAAADPTPEYTVVVLDSKDREIARDERAVLPAKGTVEYRELPLKALRVSAAEAAAVPEPANPATPAAVAKPAQPKRVQPMPAAAQPKRATPKAAAANRRRPNPK